MYSKSPFPASADELSDFTRDKRILMLSAMALVIGAMGAVAAYALLKLIALATNLFFLQRFSFAEGAPAEHHLGAWVILLPAAGGLLVGLLARFGSEKIRGHGIPEALEAILIGRSRMDPKVALLKPLSSAISIGTGGPFGAEGPIIMTGGALGSLFAQRFHLTSAERKTLLVAGAAAGMSAVFATPMAAVLLAVELLLFEWRPRSFIPVALAASVASALRAPLLGSGPIFVTPPHDGMHAWGMGLALLVGITSGFGSMVLTALVYAFEDFFHKLPVHWMWWPLAGGLAVGLGGWIDPRVFGVGYGAIHGLLLGGDLGGKLGLFLVIKTLVWAAALGSGTSGGVLAPLLIIGGTLGSLESHWLPIPDSGLWAMIGMASMMGGTMRAPLTGIAFALELTHDVSALPALLAGCVAAHAVTILLMKRSILTEKVARRGHHLTREYDVDPLRTIRVREIMDDAPATIPAGMALRELSRRIAEGDPEANRHQAFLAVDEAGRLSGILTRRDLAQALARDPSGAMTVAQAAASPVHTIYADQIAEDAVNKMIRLRIGRLAVVRREAMDRPVGYLGRSAIFHARLRRIDEESIREAGPSTQAAARGGAVLPGA
jgi:CIC family chloride channel protein